MAKLFLCVPVIRVIIIIIYLILTTIIATKRFIYFNSRLNTSFAPASLSNLIIGPIVFPRTIESSININFLPFTLTDKAPNFLATPSCRSLVLGWIKVLPTYLFLHKTSENGILD